MVLGKALGANQSTLSGLSGLGDLVLTCSSAHSRNFRLGQLIGEGQSVEQASATIGQVTEGRYTALALSSAKPGSWAGTAHLRTGSAGTGGDYPPGPSGRGPADASGQVRGSACLTKTRFPSIFPACP